MKKKLQGSTWTSTSPAAKLTLDLFREFRGFDTPGTFVQVSFPGMFPDLTRWQAEADQQKVNQGQEGAGESLSLCKRVECCSAKLDP